MRLLARLIGTGLIRTRERNDGANGSAHGEKQRQGAQPVKLVPKRGTCHIGVEDMACRRTLPALDQIHQQKCKIIQHIDRGECLVELERVEWHRPALDENDITEVEIAVAATDGTLERAGVEQRAKLDDGSSRPVGKRANRSFIEPPGHRPQSLDKGLESGHDPPGPIRTIGGPGCQMIAGRHFGKLLAHPLPERS